MNPQRPTAVAALLLVAALGCPAGSTPAAPVEPERDARGTEFAFSNACGCGCITLYRVHASPRRNARWMGTT